VAGAQRVAQIGDQAAKGEGDLGDPLGRRLEGGGRGEPLRTAARHERARVDAAGKLLEPLTGCAELRANRGTRQAGQLPHGGQPEERETLPRGLIRGEQIQGEWSQGGASGGSPGGERVEGGRGIGRGRARQARGQDRQPAVVPRPGTHRERGDLARQCHRPRGDAPLVAEQRFEARDIEECHSPANRLDPRGEVIESVQDGVEGRGIGSVRGTHRRPDERQQPRHRTIPRFRLR